MTLRSPLGRVLGQGPAKDGVSHFWALRVTSIALVPLTLWFAFALLGLPNYDFVTVRSWVGSGLNPVLLVLSVLALCWHSQLGVQVVIEDYVHTRVVKVAALLASSFAHLVAAAAGSFAVLKIALST